MKKNYVFIFVLLSALFFTFMLKGRAFAEDYRDGSFNKKTPPLGFHSTDKQDNPKREMMKKAMIHRFLKKEMPEFLEKIQSTEKDHPEAVMEFKKDLMKGEKERLFHGHFKGKIDPETKAVMQEFLELELESYILAQKYKESADENEKKNLKAELQDVLDKSFEIKAELQKKIVAKMEERILKLKELFENRKTMKYQIIKERFELITENNELTKW